MMAPFQDEQEQNLCILPLQIGSIFRRDGSSSFEVVAIDADDHLVTCKSVEGENWHIFYNYAGRHAVYENIRMNDVDRIIHPNHQLGSLGFATRFNSIFNIVDEVAFGSPAPAPTLGQNLLEIADQIYDDDDIVDARLEQPFLYNFFEHADNVPDLDETAFLRVGYRFYITADGVVPYTITAVDGDPVHTIECCDLQDRSFRFRVKSYGKEDAEPLQLRDMVDLIE